MKALTARIAGLAIASLSLLVPASALAVQSLVTGSQPEIFATNVASPSLMRERAVSVNLAALSTAMREPSPIVEVAFFDDARYLIHLQRTVATHSGGTGYVGSVLAAPTHPAIFVDNGDALSVMVVADGRRFTLQGSPERGYIARELVGADRPDHPPGTGLDLTGSHLLPKSLPGAKAKASVVEVAADTSGAIDVMILYSPTAVALNAGVANMNANVDAQVLLTNQIYANSRHVTTDAGKPVIQLRLVYKGQVNYTEINMDVDLDRVTNPTDGALDEVPMLRELYKADLVSLWGSYSDYCGLGWLMANENANFNTLGYNIVASPSCTGAGSYTFAHEMGHNMGLRHDHFADDTQFPSTVVSPLGAPVNPGTTGIFYAHGYIDLTNRFRTVMSYNDQCVANHGTAPPTFGCTRIPHFANPAVNYSNNPPYPQAMLATTGFLDVAQEMRALWDTAETVANFRTGLATFTGPGIVSLLPPWYAVAEAGGSVVLTVGRHVGTTGTITVQYATVPGTATAGADYTHTTGTLTWTNGDNSPRTITVPILQDSVLEGNHQFTVSLTAPTGGAFIGSSGSTSQNATVVIVDDEADTFPIGSLLPGGFVSPNVPTPNTPNSQWTVNLAEGYQSTASLQSQQMFSTNQTDFVNSDLEYTGVFRNGNVNFAFKMSTYHQGYGQFQFSIDGVVVFENLVGGEVDWTVISRAVSQGVHTLRWRFKSRLPFPCDNVNPPAPGGGSCKGRVFIDAIQMPLARPFDFSGEGATDLLWRNTDGRQSIWLMSATTPMTTQDLIGAGAHGWSVTNVADLNGDGRSDLVWQNTDGRVALYLMNGVTPTATQQILNAGGGWSVTHTPDLNGDGKADLLFQNTDGTVAVWTMNGVTMTAGASIFNAGAHGWSVIKTADFDGDGNDDLVWRHTDGRHAIWLMNGIAIKATTQILNAGGWTVQHAVDLNGDGRADIVWQHADGTLALWLMNGATMTSGAGILGAGSGWTIPRTGDFDGDGLADLLFLHADGRAAIWLMNGLVTKTANQILNAGGGWTPRRTGDLDQDGRSDIVWQNTDGRVAVWLMNGAVMSSGGGIFGPGTNWTVSTVSQ